MYRHIMLTVSQWPGGSAVSLGGENGEYMRPQRMPADGRTRTVTWLMIRGRLRVAGARRAATGKATSAPCRHPSGTDLGHHRLRHPSGTGGDCGYGWASNLRCRCPEGASKLKGNAKCLRHRTQRPAGGLRNTGRTRHRKSGRPRHPSGACGHSWAPSGHPGTVRAAVTKQARHAPPTPNG